MRMVFGNDCTNSLVRPITCEFSRACTGYLGHPFGKGLNYKEKIVIVPKKVKDSLQAFSYFEQISQVASTRTIYELK